MLLIDQEHHEAHADTFISTTPLFVLWRGEHIRDFSVFSILAIAISHLRSWPVRTPPPRDRGRPALPCLAPQVAGLINTEQHRVPPPYPALELLPLFFLILSVAHAATEFFITCRPACRRDVFLVCRRDSSSCFRKQVHRRGHQLPIHGQEGGGILLREAPSSWPNQARQRAVLRWLMDWWWADLRNCSLTYS